MSKKQNNALQKMENTTMENNATINNREPDWANNVRKHPIHGLIIEPARAISNIMKNHREGKITNAQRNAELNTRQRYNKQKRVRMFTSKEIKARAKAKKKNREAGLHNNFSLEYAAALPTNSGQRARDFNRRLQQKLNEQTKQSGAKKNKLGGARKTKIKRKKHKRKSRKKRKGRRKKGGHHELVLLAGAAGMKVYNSLTKKKRRKKRKRKTKRK